MKRKKTLIFAISLGFATSFSSVLAVNRTLFTSFAGYACDSTGHNGNHYDAKASTALKSGNKEFWACCKCHEQFLSNPGGTFVNKGQYIGNLESTHIAYIAPTGASSTYNVADYYNGYYTPIVSWSNGEDLKSQLHSLIRTGYQPINYDDANWESNQYADQDLYLTDSVNPVYSSETFLKTNTNTGWQREHAFAASLMTGYTTSDVVGTEGRTTDFHNLFAAYGSGNSSRANKIFGVADPNDATYQGNTKGDYKCDSQVFEPNDFDKGRLSRAIFYMGVMYNEQETNIDVPVTLNYNAADQTTYGQKSKKVHLSATYEPITIIEGPVNYSKAYTYTKWYYAETEDIQNEKAKYAGMTNEESFAAYSKDNCQFAFGNLSTLLNWNNSFDVDLLEMQHNESVYSHAYKHDNNEPFAQGNRNPFVDYPELVDYVYGDKKELPGQLNTIMPSEYALNMNNTDIDHYAIDNIDREFNVNDILSEGTSYQVYAVKKDLSRTPVTLNTNADYTFVKDDLGTKSITLNTPINQITYSVEVKPAVTGNTWSHTLSGYGAGNDFEGLQKSSGVENLVTLSGIKWNVYWKQNAIGSSGSSPSSGGVKFGANTTPVDTLRFTSYSAFTFNSKTKIANITFEGNAASGCSYNYTVKIGNTVVSSGNMAYSADPKIVVYSKDITTDLSGVITIEFTNINKAIYINALSVTTKD